MPGHGFLSIAATETESSESLAETKCVSIHDSEERMPALLEGTHHDHVAGYFPLSTLIPCTVTQEERLSERLATLGMPVGDCLRGLD